MVDALPVSKSNQVTEFVFANPATTSPLDNLRHVPSDGFFKLTGLCVEFFEFFVEPFE